jgi:hypothetical protein
METLVNQLAVAIANKDICPRELARKLNHEVRILEALKERLRRRGHAN